MAQRHTKKIGLAEQFLEEIEEFLARTGMPPTTFGKVAVNDTHLVWDLREGRSVTTRSIDKIREFMATYREDAA